MSKLRRNIPGVLLIASLVCVVPLLAQLGSKTNEWRAYSGNAGSTRYSSLDLINRDNFKNLTVAWSWSLANYGGGTTETTPIMANNMLYFTVGQARTVVAVNPGTGETLWIWRPPQDARESMAPRKITRGVAYWSDGGDGSNDRIITVTPGFRLVALNAKTGAPVSTFGQNGTVDLFTQLDADPKMDLTGKIGNSSAPVVSNGVIVIGPAMTQGGANPNKENVKGDILAFDVRTGKKQWIFHTIPRKGEAGYETWLNGSADYTGNTGAWGPMSADDELGHVYIATESPTNDGYGGHRPGDNLYSDSIVCLDIKTGKMIWFKQLIRHDIWDYDMPAHPILVDINVDGRPVKAVVQSGKISLVYVFDRATGKPVWPIPDVPVPQTTVPTEWTPATQPIPTKPKPFDVVGLTIDDLINFTPEMRNQAVQALQGYTYGMIFMPPTIVTPGVTKGTIMVPGFGGGNNWQSGAADPETGFVYYGSITSPSPVGVVKTDPPDPTKADYTAARGVAIPNIQGLPLLKPPYGRITAYDMNKGDIAWQVPNGDTPQNYKTIFANLGLTVPPTGTRSVAGLLVTKTLLIAGEGSGGHPLLHAYDKKTGENLAEIPMPGNQTALPMTYSFNGRQFIVLAVNGQQGQAGQLVAFAIPAPGGAGGGRGGRGGGGAAAPAPPAAGAGAAVPAGPAGGARGGAGGGRGGRGGGGAPAPAPVPQN